MPTKRLRKQTRTEAVVRRRSLKKAFWEISQNPQKHVSQACNFIKIESLAQVISCEFCEISKNTSGRLLLAIPLLLMFYYFFYHSYLNYANTVWWSTMRIYLNKLQSQQNHTIRSIFQENKLAHTWEIFKGNNVLNIYQLNIFNNLLFLHRVKNGKVPNVFLSKFLRASHY